MFQLKRTTWILLMSLVIMGTGLASPAHAKHPYKTEAFKLNAEPMEPKAVSSGSGASCSNDFAIRNTHDRSAEIQIVLGGMPFAREQIPAKGIKMYNLKKNLALAKLNGKLVDMNDWAFIINATPGQSSIQVFCSR